MNQNTETLPGVLIEDGRARATIVLSAEAGSAEWCAARDLQCVLHAMTGAMLLTHTDEEEIPEGNRVLIGDTRFTDAVVSPQEREAVGREGYVARLRGRDLALAGGGRYGTIYAVAELYDRLGARWYLPGELGECIPKRQTVRFESLDVSRTPSFRMRWVGWHESEWIRSQTHRDDTWNLRNRTNTVYDPGLPPAFAVEPTLYHSQQDFLPDYRYVKDHPEYFALADDSRRNLRVTSKLCNSNPEVAKELAANMAALLRDKPHTDLIALSPSDGQGWCECPQCRALDEPGVPADQTFSRRQMVLYNRVAEELGKEFPDQQILAGAYNVYTWPPKDPTIKAHPNLAVVICHYDQYCMGHGVGDPDCPPNRRYLELIRAWQRLTPNVYFYEYYEKGSWCDLPWPIVHTIAEDIPFFKELGVQGLYTQHIDGQIWSNFLNMYVAARLLWDHTTDVPALLEEFYAKFYGPAAAPMKRYHELLEGQMASREHHISGGAVVNARHVFTEAVLNELADCLREARGLADDDLIRRRLEKMTTLQDFTERLMRFLELHRAVQASEDASRREAMAREAVETIEGLLADIREDPVRYRGIVILNAFGRSLYSGKLRPIQQRVQELRDELGMGPPIHWRPALLPDEIHGSWRFLPDPQNLGVQRGWFQPAFDDSRWVPVKTHLSWQFQDYTCYHGHAWYRTPVSMPEELRGGDVRLRFEGVETSAWVYWNGQLLDERTPESTGEFADDLPDQPFSVAIPAEAVGEQNLLAVHVYDPYDDGGLIGPVRLQAATDDPLE